MATIKFTYGDVQDHAAYVGEENTISVDTEKKTLRVHDGVTPGGSALATEEQLEVFVNSDMEIVAGDGLTGGGFLDGEQVNVSLGTPSTITGSTINESSANSHSHAISLNKNDVGLSNVDNTSDLNKPISTATQTALNAKVNTSDIGVTVAALVNGKVPLSQMDDSVLGQVEYKGTWNATTNVPTLPATPAEKGIYYVVSTGGTFQSISFAVGDWIISNGSVWQKVDNTDAVSSVAGKTGAVTLTKTDVGLSNVDNTSDLNKPISTATQTALNAKAPLASPVFTGNPEVPTQLTSDNSKKVANTEFVKAVVDAKDVGVTVVSGTAPINVSGGISTPTISITPATQSSAGSMSAADKSKLDGIQAGAEQNTVDSVAGKTGDVALSASDIGGLGTAATANLTTSAFDTTAGRVLKNGDWGIPTDINMWVTPHANVGGDTGTDLNTLTTAGWWRKLISPSSINRPSGGSGYWYLLVLKYAATANITQIAFPYGTGTNGNIQYRSQYNGIWGEWRTLYDSNNLSLTESSTDGTAGRVTKVGDFGLGASGDGVRVSGDIDNPDLLLAGFYSVLPPTTLGTFPAGWGSFGGTLLVETFRVGSGTRFVKQTLTGNGSLGNKVYFRLYNGNTSTWSVWLELLHLGNQLNIGTTATSARAALGLGTAAVGTLTESTTDDIVGKVMKVGDFGIGSNAVTLTGVDMNTVVRTGFYIITSPVNGPAGTTTTNLLVLGNTSGSGRAMQIAQPVNSETYYVRSQSAGTWSTWKQLYHSGNLLNIGTTAAAARTALGLATGATTTVGTIATQNANAVSITGGSVAGITDLAIADGGTGASTAAGARSNLGLGTAAVADVTTSSTDTTAGRVMKTGDFGLGAGQVAVSDCNSATLTGFYVTGGSAANRPAGAGASVWMAVFGDGSSVVHQYCYDPTTSEVYYRRLSSSVWSEWRKFFHSGNQLDIGTTAASARTALGLGTAATAGLDNLIASTTTQQFGTNNTERVRIDASGNVGIGTTSPAGRLSIAGSASDAWATGSSGGLTFNGVSSSGVSTISTFLDNTSIRIGAGVTQKTGIFINGQTAAGGSYVAFSAGGAERVRVDSSGLTVTNNITQNGVSIRPYGSSGSDIRVFKNLAAYTVASASVTGTLKITLPFSFTQSMITLKLKGYNYNTTGYWEMNLAGYVDSTSSVWTQTSADTNGTSTPFTSVRFGHDGTRCCILLGTTSTVLNYPKVIIDELMVSFAGSTSDWSTGWSISQITDETGITVSSTPTVFVGYNGQTPIPGRFDQSTTAPTSTTRLNYNGHFYATSFYGDSSQLSVVSTSSNGVMSAADKTKLDGIASGAQVNAVTSVAGKTGAVTLTKTDVGLSNVDNTSDLNKPISTATQTALNNKLNANANAVSASKLQTARTINGVPFDGTANITVADPTKVPSAGGNLTGDLTYQNVGVGGWARGLTAKIQSSGAYAAGIGFLGNGDSVSTAYLGVGASPWASGDGVRVSVSGVTISGATTFDSLIVGARAMFTGTGNDYGSGGLEVIGNGSANTVFPTIGFHQPGLWASSIQLRGASDFRFYAQGGTAYADVTAARFYGDSSQMSVATTSANGVMSAADKAKLDSLSTTAGISEDDAIVLALIFG